MGSATKKTKRARLFKKGRSQAVRLPREFRFEGDDTHGAVQGMMLHESRGED